MHIMATEGKPRDGAMRTSDLQARTEVDVLPSEAHMHEAHTGNPGDERAENEVAEGTRTTVITLEITHNRELPRTLYPAIETQALSLCHLAKVDVVACMHHGYRLPVKEQA